MISCCYIRTTRCSSDISESAAPGCTQLPGLLHAGRHRGRLLHLAREVQCSQVIYTAVLLSLGLYSLSLLFTAVQSYLVSSPPASSPACTSPQATGEGRVSWSSGITTAQEGGEINMLDCLVLGLWRPYLKPLFLANLNSLAVNNYDLVRIVPSIKYYFGMCNTFGFQCVYTLPH